MNPSDSDLSAVIPVCNEEANLAELHARLEAVLRGLGRPYEVIYVDDGSTDRSLEILTALQRRQPDTVRVVELYRNCGQFAATMAGLELARGSIVVTLDADLQNPPEEIPRLLAKIEEGYDVVNGCRRDRRDSLFRRLFSRAASRIASRITGVRLRDYGCMLRAYRREVVRQMASCGDRSIYIPTLANALARRVAEVEVAHSRRTTGRSKYPLVRLIGLQYDLMTSVSILPLRMLTFFGLAVAALAAGFGALVTGRGLVGGAGPRLEPVLFALLFFLMGLLFCALGLLGEYVGRIYGDVRGRPRFVVRQVQGRPADVEVVRSGSTPQP